MHAVVIAGLLPLLSLAQFRPVDTQKEKEELIIKLGSDINKVDHSIDVTKTLIQHSPDAPYLADLYFRLAELYVERSRYVYSKIMESKPEGENSLGGEQALEVQITKHLAIETYDKVLSEFPEYDKNDQIRFFKAHEYRELGEFDTMLTLYKELIQKHGRSDWAIEARLILGDHHFDKNDLVTAEKYYKEILSLPESHLHDMARYKLGWIRINQEKFDDALRLFEGAVRSKRKKKRGAVGDAHSLDVKKEAMLALVWPFSEVRKAAQAPGYFRNLAESKTLYVAVMRKLANRYFVKTEYVNAALLYRHIVPLSADVQENVEYVQRIYESITNMSKRNRNRYAHAATDVKAIVKTVARFQNHLNFTEDQKSKLTHDLELRARDLATRLHQQAQAKNDEQSAYIASEAYRRYLSLFREPKVRQEMQLNRASALMETKTANNFVKAGLQQEIVAHEIRDKGDAPRDAVYQAILSFYKALQKDGEYRRKHPTKPRLLNKLETLRAREGLKQLGSFYVKSWPKSPQVVEVKFNVASMYYQQAEYKKASELFAQFVREYPTHKDMANAGQLALDCLYRLDDLEGLAKLSDEFVANKSIRDMTFKNAVAKSGKSARARGVQTTLLQAAQEEDFGQAMLERWESMGKDSDQAEDVLYAAFVKYKNESHVAGVYQFGGRMMGAYPKSPKLKDVLGTMGAFAVRAADFERAAAYFEEFYRRFPKAPNAKSVLASAANIRLLMGDFDKAAAAFRSLRKEGDAGTRRNAHEKLMEIYRESRNWDELARVAQTALQENRNWLGAAFHLGVAYLEQNKFELAEKELRRAAGMRANGDFDAQASGRAPFELGRLMHRRFDKLQFRDADTAEQVLGAKVELMGAMEQSYVAAIQSGQGEWGIAGLYEVARAYHGFGEFIAGAPAPGGLSQADLKQYKEALNEQGGQYKQKAKETMQVCKDKALELKVFSPFARACLAGTYGIVDASTVRARSRVTGDETYQKHIAALREKLVKTPEHIDTLLQIARSALAVGDYHLAKLTLGKAVETDPRSATIQNLIGVTNWNLGKTQEAYEAFKKASDKKLKLGSLNLAALYHGFGYEKYAAAALRRAGDIGGVDLTVPDLHSSVAASIQELGGQ